MTARLPAPGVLLWSIHIVSARAHQFPVWTASYHKPGQSQRSANESTHQANIGETVSQFGVLGRFHDYESDDRENSRTDSDICTLVRPVRDIDSDEEAYCAENEGRDDHLVCTALSNASQSNVPARTHKVSPDATVAHALDDQG